MIGLIGREEKTLLSNKLLYLRKGKGLSQTAVAKSLGVTRSAYSQYELGTRNPDYDTLKRIASYFDVSIDYLLSNTSDPEKQDNSPDGVYPYEPDKMIKLPVLGSIRAGEPLLMNDNFEGFEFVEPDLMRGREGFILKVKGDSMIGDRIYEGDRVVCIKQSFAEPHEIAVVAIDNEEATLKRVKCVDGTCILSSSNTAKEPMIYPAHMVKILGVAISVRHDL